MDIKYAVWIETKFGYNNSMTYGKVYEVKLCDDILYTIIDNHNQKVNFFKTRFRDISLKHSESKLFKLLYDQK